MKYFKILKKKTPCFGVFKFQKLKYTHARARALHTYTYIYIHIHHHVVLVARISLTLSCHFSLSFIPSGRSSGLHPVSSHSCWMYVRAGRPAFARPRVGAHKSTSLMSSSLLLQQCPACLVRLACSIWLHLYIKSDKGVYVLILNRYDYINKMSDILNDTSKFMCLASVDEFDKTAIPEQRIQHQLPEFYKDHQILKSI